MRTAKTCHLLLLFSLALFVFCGQLPELFTLIDDTSNDFVEESLVPVSASVESAPVSQVSQSSFVFEEESNRTAAITPSKQTLPSFSSDLLRLFFIQRK